jgi:hypothetical protein
MQQEQLLDRSKLTIQSVDSRSSDLHIDDVWEAGERHLGSNPEWCLTSTAVHNIGELAKKVAEARANDRGVFIFMGGHLIKLGLSRNIIDWIDNGVVTHVAMNGACIIHDYELFYDNVTSENVAQYIKTGEFGLWESMSELNQTVSLAFGLHDDADSRGWREVDTPFCLAEALGGQMNDDGIAGITHGISILTHAVSVTASAHILIGADINHMQQNFDAEMWALGSYNDFLLLAEQIRLHLGDGGVFINIGSAVHGPETFLKALSMARNISPVDNFHTAVLDLQQVQGGWHIEPTVKTDPAYYFRPWKTILSRALSGTGESYYIQGHFAESIPRLRNAIAQEMDSNG